jgi:transcriptional regulator with GAF, ATPase, and Fis domain
LVIDRFFRLAVDDWRDLATGRSVRLQRLRCVDPTRRAELEARADQAFITGAAMGRRLVDCGLDGARDWVEACDASARPARLGTTAPRVGVAAGVRAELLDRVHEVIADSEDDVLRMMTVPACPGFPVVGALLPLARFVRQRGVLPLWSGWVDGSVRHDDRVGGWLLSLLRHRRVLVLVDASWGSSFECARRRERCARWVAGAHLLAGVRAIICLLGVADVPPSAAGNIRLLSASSWSACPPTPLYVREGVETFVARPSTAAGRFQLDATAAEHTAKAEGLARRGRHAEACRMLARVAGERRRRLDLGGSGTVLLAQGQTWRLRGRVAQAERCFRDAREHFDQASSTQGVLASVLHLAALVQEDDRLGECGQLLQLAAGMAGQLRDADAAEVAAWARIHWAYWDGRPQDAVAGIEALDRRTRPEVVTGVAEVASWVTPLLPRPLPVLLERLVRRRVGLAVSSGLAGVRPIGPENPSAPDQASLLDRLAWYESEVLGLASVGSWLVAEEALDRGLAETREAHAPLMGLSLRLTFAEAIEVCGGRGQAASDRGLCRWARVPLPRLFRRRLDTLTCNRPSVSPPAHVRGWAPAGGLTTTGVIALIDAVNDASDERSGIERVCAEARARLGAAAVTLFVRQGDAAIPLINTGHRACDLDEARRVMEGVSGASPGESAITRMYCPIRLAGETIGVVGARWTTNNGADGHAQRAYLDALAAVCGPSVRALREPMGPVEAEGPTSAILGTSRQMADLRALVSRAAAAPFPVLIQGESGTGKELTARAIHLSSRRRTARLCAVNCAALTEELLEAELFGHTRGAFTGAVSERPGLFETADGGTLFLDEIGELSPRGQAKLLRALQEHEVRRVGESVPRKVDVRVVAASNRPLVEACQRGQFRQDLLYRLDVIRIDVPPLRERPEDIPILISVFWKVATEQAGCRAILSPDAVAALSARPWPGNVRELQNSLATLAVRGPQRGRVGPGEVAAVLPGRERRWVSVSNLDTARREFETRFVREALVRAGGRRTRAAADLGVTRQGLAKLISRLRLDAGC